MHRAALGLFSRRLWAGYPSNLGIKNRGGATLRVVAPPLTYSSPTTQGCPEAPELQNHPVNHPTGKAPHPQYKQHQV